MRRRPRPRSFVVRGLPPGLGAPLSALATLLLLAASVSPVVFPEPMASGGVIGDRTGGGPTLAFVASSAGVGVPPTSASSTGGWTRAGPPLSSPPGVSGLFNGSPYGAAWEAYDAQAAELVVFAGATNASGAPASTWALSGGQWTLVRSTSGVSTEGPEACPGSVMAYDPWAGEVLLYEDAGNGAVGLCGDAGETWAFSGTAWSELATTRSPPVGSGAGSGFAWMGADPASGEFLFFGTSLAAPWEFANGTWSPAPTATTSPPASSEEALAYDAEDGVLLDFVTYASDAWVNETWEYAAGNWSELSTPAPPPEYGGVLVDDPADGYVALTGGWSVSNQPLHDLWTFVGGVWTNRSTGSIPPLERSGSSVRYTPEGGYDPGLTAILYVDLPDQSVANGSLIWTYHDGAWENLTVPSPGPVPAGELVDDPADGYAVLLTSGGETWTYGSGSWAELNLSRSPPYGPIAYDASSGYVVLVAQRETWEFAGGRWAEITPSLSPPACSGGGAYCWLAYDPLEGGVVYVDGEATNASGTWVGSTLTWEFENGTWSNLTSSAGSPNGGPIDPIAFDPSLGGVVMLGTTNYTAAPPSNGTWVLSGGVWSELGVADALPAAVENASVAFDASGPGLLVFGGGSTSSTWFLNGTGWHLLASGSAPSPRAGAALTALPAPGGVLLFGGDGLPDWWTWSFPAGGGGPTVRSVSASPDPVDVGVNVTITVSASGGTAPLSYAYGGLPNGCASRNTSALTCAPTRNGTFTVIVVVTDAAGDNASGTTSLTVVADPEILQYVAEPSSVPVGVRTLLETEVSGGEAPYTYAYGALPAGCFSQDVPILPCVPQTAGAYAPTVTVTDAEGETVARTAALAVAPGGVAGSPTIESFTVVPYSVTLGNATTFAVNATEGSTPLSYSYAGLPPGCPATNASTFTCVPSTAGAYLVTVAVTDSAGHASQANLTLDVAPVGALGHPIVQSFTATPGIVPVGNATLLVAILNGSSTGLSFRYAGLPTGCVSADTSRLPCVPRAVGTFRIVLTVEGALGNATAVPTVVRVVGGPAPAVSPSPLPTWAVAAGAAFAGGLIAAGLLWEIGRYRLSRRKTEGEAWLRTMSDEGQAGSEAGVAEGNAPGGPPEGSDGPAGQ